MASVSDILSSSTIDSLVSSFISNEQSKKIDPLTTRQTKYQSLSTAYSTLSSKLNELKSLLSDLKKNDTTSIFLSKTAASSNTNFVSVNATGAAAASSYVIRVNQLAKNDLLLGINLDSTAYSSVITSEGSHTFRIKTGDGSGGEYTANVEVDFEASDFDTSGITNKALMEKIRNAINLDKAIVTSDEKNGSDTYSGGESSFTINLNGTEKTITIASATDYNDLINQLVTNINTNVSGVTAEKIVNGENVSLKITVNDSSKYISISNSSGFDLVSDLNIGVTKEKGASGIVTASVFSPVSGKSQLSLTAKEAGNDYRITDLYESGGSNLALNSIGIDFGTARTSYVQNPGGEDIAGFVYDTSLLNSKFEFNGISMERSSNSITDLIDGATVNLKSVMQSSDTDVAISFANDNATIRSKIESFVTKFNDIYGFIKSKSTATSSGTRGIFIGDANASSLLQTFTSSAYSSVSGISENEINSLSKLGITFNSNSGLTISDSSQLDKVISENVDQVASLFNSTNGIAASLYTRVNSYIGTTGYLTQAKTAADKLVTNLNDSVTKAQEKIDKAGESLRSRYQQLQLQISNLLSMQSMLFGA
jgi:flagellar hook-associated protein 2